MGCGSFVLGLQGLEVQGFRGFEAIRVRIREVANSLLTPAPEPARRLERDANAGQPARPPKLNFDERCEALAE